MAFTTSLSGLHLQVKHLLRSVYFTLYYYQQIVDQYGIYHDRKAFSRLHQHLDQYCLQQYRQTVQKAKVPPLAQQSAYPEKVSPSPPAHLLAMKVFMLAVLTRCLLIALLPQLVAASAEQRITLGTALWGPEEFRYLETAVALWSAIVCCTLQFTLSSNPLNYQSLALFRMNDGANDGDNTTTKFHCFHYANFGLRKEQFVRFAAFRSRALLAYHAIIGGILSLAPVVLFGLCRQSGMLSSHPLLSAFWSTVLVLVAVCICTVIYGNLVAFTVVARYLVLKQMTIARQLTNCLLQLGSNQVSRLGAASVLWDRLIPFSTHHAHLYKELYDYCDGLWSSYLSFVFAFYIIIISFLLYIVLLSGMAFYFKGIMLMGLVAHVGLLVVIIANCGSLVKRNERLARRFEETIGRLGKSNLKGQQQQPQQQQLPTKTHFLKVSNVAAAVSLCASQSGVQLLNGYLVCYDTFRLLAVNITMYFILFIKK